MRPLALTLLASASFPALALAQAEPPSVVRQPHVNLNQYQVPPIIPTASAQTAPDQNQTIVAHPTGTPPGSVTQNVYMPPNPTPAANTNAPSATPTSQPTAAPVNGQDKIPKYMPPPIPLLSHNRPMRPVERRAVSAAAKWTRAVVPPTMGIDGRQHFNGSVGEPYIVCAPLHVCDIALSPGEIVNPPLENGDPRWIVNPGISGSGFNRVTHLFIKPTDAGLNSNLIVSTNKRVLSLRLVSRTGAYMPLVQIDEEPTVSQNVAWSAYQSAIGGGGSGGFGAGETACDQAPSTPPSEFKIERVSVAWLPVQVYAVSTPNGPKTCIQFPASIGSSDLPTLLLLGNDGGWFSGPSEQIVNYRYVKGRFELDRLIDRAVLVSGVGSSQDKAEITRRRP